ncbi:MAG: methyltransferase domain-containing protein [Bacteroidia bacterium]|nr:methyltransferase domain-containing protein [Bacteroidia bacterium]
MGESWIHFWRASLEDFHHTGAIAPSSVFLARAMTAVLRPPRPAWTILEVGPGTGAITTAILEHLLPNDQLDIVEINGLFVERLRKRFEEDPRFRLPCSQVRLYHTAVEKFYPPYRFDCIISGLPLNNFHPERVREILGHFERLLQPNGFLIYFEYVGVRHLKKPFSSRAEKHRLYRIERITQNFLKKHGARKQLVLLNLPPAFVYALQMGKK